LATDYRKFKTPFYEITVGDPSWKRKVKLPHHILRLVDKIEINENMILNADAQPTSMSITFIEGSREPASPDYKLGTSGLYQIPLEGDNVDMDIAGSLTNRSGIITDLRFSGSGGITFLTEYEKKTGKVDNRQQKNVEDKNTTRKYKSEPKAPLFLFQERNKIRVTWGYVEDPTTVRSIMMDIRVITTDFPQEGMPTTTVTGFSFSSTADQIATKKAKVFGTKKVTSKDGDSLIVFEDLKTDDLIKKIAKDAGMAAIVSSNLPNDIADKDKQKMWLAGESFHQFMKKMADLSGCYYEILADPNTGKENILFIKYADFERKVVISDPELLHWKGPGSILKNITVTADFGGMQGNQQAGLDEKGEEGSVDDQTQIELLRRHKTSEGTDEQAMSTDPKGVNPNPTAVAISETVANGGTTGVVENTPNTSEKSRQDKAAVGALKNAKMITIDFNTIGYTRLIPGVMEIRGIGVRYSGKYRVISVTHTIDSNGYVCKCSGNSQMLAAGGVVIPPAAPQGEEDEQVKVQLLNTQEDPNASNFGSENSPEQKYWDLKMKQLEK
jgi:hypothetical protein